MKSFSTLIAILLSVSTYAQLVHESPYVSDNKSFKFTIPEIFYSVEFDASLKNRSNYCSSPTIDFETEKIEDDFITIELSKAGPSANMKEEYEELKKLPQYSHMEAMTLKNGQFFVLSFELTTDSKGNESSNYMAYTYFDDALVSILLYDYDNKHVWTTQQFKSIIESFEIYETDREGTYDPEEKVIEYGNSMYETKFSYGSIDFYEIYNDKSNCIWDEEFGSNYPELLLAVTAVDEEQSAYIGGLKVFSGGTSTDFQSASSKLEAVQEVFKVHYITGIQQSGELEGEEFNFNVFNINHQSKLYPSQKLYITTCRGEMLFILTYAYEKADQELENCLIKLVESMTYYEDLDGDD